MPYSQEQIKRLEEKKKALSAKIAKAKRSLARKNAEDERKRRTHQMCVFAGDVENIFENIFQEKLFIEENQGKLDYILKKLNDFFEKYHAAGKEFPPKEKPIEEQKTSEIEEFPSFVEEPFDPDSF